MANRTILFGYKYDNGRIVLDSLAADIVKEIFSQYLDKKSLLEISTMLNKLHIEYQPGVVNWNKSRIKRILEDDRYLGNDTYPQIIDSETMMMIKSLKDSKNNQQGVDRKSNIYFISSYVVCPKCGDHMKRVVDKRNEIHNRWKCQNPICKITVAKDDDDYTKEIIGLMNYLIIHPDCIMEIKIGSREGESVSIMDNEINHMLDFQHIDRETLKCKILEAVSIKYSRLDPAKYISRRIRNLFTIQQPNKMFPLDLFRQAVENISFDKDCNAIIILKNGQTMGKESIDGSAYKESQSYRSDQKCQRDGNGKIPAEAGSGILQGIDAAGRTA